MLNQITKRILSSLIILPLALFFIIKGEIYFNLFLLIIFLISIYEWNIMSKKKIKILGFVFLIFSFYSAYKLRSDFDYESLFLILFVISICISTDIGGYIFGKVLKGPKLTSISPNKTYSGLFGGYILSFILIFLFCKYSDYIFQINSNFNLQVFLITLIISTTSQIGDITVSFFKRMAKIKDTGKLIPGHGGVLDRIDGMIFAIPLFYLIKIIGVLK